MGDVIAFDPKKKKTAWQKNKGKSLCRDGFHKWQVVTDNKFDVKEGKLVTLYRCSRCGIEKTKAH